MILTTKITMDLSNPAPAPVIHAVQDDQYSRNLELTQLSNGIPWIPPEGTTAIVSYRKSDGTGGNYDALPDGTTAVTISGNIITVALAPQVLTFPGVVRLSVGLINGSSKLYTFSVLIDVQANPGLTAISDNYFKIAGALSDSGWEPNMYLGTDYDGNVVVKEVGGGSSGATFFPYVDADGNLSWSNNGGLENPGTVNINGYTPVKGTDYYTDEDKAEIVDEVLAAIPTLKKLDMSGFDSGTWTETLSDGSAITHTNTFDDSGRVIAIDDIEIEWGDA